MQPGPRHARTLSERFSPEDGAPLRVGSVWPPRLMVHNVCTKADADVVEISALVWLRHHLVVPLEVGLQATGPPVDGEGRAFEGLQLSAPALEIAPPQRRRAAALTRHDGVASAGDYHPVPVILRWSRAFAERLQDVRWVRVPIEITLSDGETTRRFQWYAYLTPHAAEVPLSGAYDDHPHFRWVDPHEGPLIVDGAAHAWVELPAPLSSPTLSPACWVQVERGEPEHGGPEQVELAPVFPVEPAIPAGLEAVGWNGALGGHDPRPRVQALAVDSRQTGGVWGAWLHYWDTPARGHSAPVRLPRITPLESPTDCVWPEIQAVERGPLVLYDLQGRDQRGCEIKVNLPVVLPEDAESVLVRRADIRLGAEDVGRWEGPPVELVAGQERSLTCVIDLHRLREVRDGRLKLTLVFYGRPTRGVIRGEHVLRTDNGPWARLMRSRTHGGSVRTPWLSIDLGTEGSCAAVGFLDGYVPRVISVHFDGGPVYPTRVYLAPALGGAWTLTDEPSDETIYTTRVKMGLRFGDGAHPGTPDHIAATEVARFFLKRFLLEVKERMAWFPLDEADVLVSFPPRLASMPRFVQALRDTFRSVLEEVIWSPERPVGSGEPHEVPPAPHRPGRLFFREEGLLVAIPALYRDLEVAPMAPGRSRYYWVMDFGGGTTDVCGFLCTADPDGEEHIVSRMVYPQRLPHHQAGNDVTAAFYAAIHHQLSRWDLVAGPESDGEDDDLGIRRFPLPATPFPSARSTPTALMNQTTVRELADALKCLSPDDAEHLTVRAVARSLRQTRLRTVDGVTTTIVALLTGEAAQLGEKVVARLHEEVLYPDGAHRTPIGWDRRGEGPVPAQPVGDKATVRCERCEEAHTLPLWAFASNRMFRFRCRACSHPQRVQLQQDLPLDLDESSTPMILEYRDTQVQEPVEDGATEELYVEQDGRTYVVKDWDTLRRWVEERRISPDDLFSEGGIRWQPLRERAELSGLFEEAQVLAVDTTQEIPRPQPVAYTPPVGPRARPPLSDRPQLGRDIDLFLTACREALERALADLPDGPVDDVVVLVAGRASQFRPIAEGIHRILPGRVVHLTNDWVRRTYGNAGQIDPNAGLKTLTANGGALFALLQSNPDTSTLLLSVDTQVMDCAVYLQAASASRPWLITRQLDLRPGLQRPLVAAPEEERLWVEDLGTSAEEPPPRPLPVDTPLTGELCLVVEGLPEDRHIEPYVTIARGTARRWQGRRARITGQAALRTEQDSFVLTGLTDDREIAFVRMLPRLELLGGGAGEASGPEGGS